MVFKTTFAGAIESLEPTIRNSNLLPVKANGEVLFLSAVSRINSGIAFTPVSNTSRSILWSAVPVVISWFITSVSCSPKNTEIIAGGASFAPKRWSFPTSAADSRKSSACSSTALRIQLKIKRNWILSWGVLPGSSKFTPVSVVRDQLLCFPEPFTPAKGFSWSRHFIPCCEATRFKVCITIWLWSTSTFASA